MTILKYTVVEGDTSLSGTFTVTGTLAFGDRASHNYTFKFP